MEIRGTGENNVRIVVLKRKRRFLIVRNAEICCRCMGLLTGEVLSAYVVNQTKQQVVLQKNGFGLFLDCKRVKDGELRGGKGERLVFRLMTKAVMKK